MKDTAIAFSDWEAVKLSFALRRKRRESSEAEADRPVAAGPLTAEAGVGEPALRTKGFADPWPGHRLSFDQDAIRAKGYVSSAQTVLSGVQGYTFYRTDGVAQFMRPEMVLMQKLAKKL